MFGPKGRATADFRIASVDVFPKNRSRARGIFIGAIFRKIDNRPAIEIRKNASRSIESADMISMSMGGYDIFEFVIIAHFPFEKAYQGGGGGGIAAGINQNIVLTRFDVNAISRMSIAKFHQIN